VQPAAKSQLSVVQVLPSSQFSALPPLHAPFLQVSPVVQALPSSQLPLAAVWLQPVAASQASVVHGFASSQVSVVPVHRPTAQLSPVVHASPSVHGPLASVWVQPAAKSQLSVVQVLPSSQFSALPPLHAPFLQVSPVVHALPSSQAPDLRAKLHLPATHVPVMQALGTEQALSSEQPMGTSMFGTSMFGTSMVGTSLVGTSAGPLSATFVSAAVASVSAVWPSLAVDLSGLVSGPQATSNENPSMARTNRLIRKRETLFIGLHLRTRLQDYTAALKAPGAWLPTENGLHH
jgi:hypothetical protein